MTTLEELIPRSIEDADGLKKISTSYYDRETDLDIIRQLHALTKPGGILVIDIANRDWIIKNYGAKDVQYSTWITPGCTTRGGSTSSREKT
jgi:hypothetical protein